MLLQYTLSLTKRSRYSCFTEIYSHHLTAPRLTVMYLTSLVNLVDKKSRVRKFYIFIIGIYLFLNIISGCLKMNLSTNF